MRQIAQYRDWLIESDFLYKRFDLLTNVMIEYIRKKLYNAEVAGEVASEFSNVLKSCDEIDYNKDSTAIAYSILHFLPRYHRFQLVFNNMLENDLIPLKNKPINILDIGTGPGPTLFALSDLYLSLNLFGKKYNIEKLIKQEYIPDYVERSRGFRNWLHHFTEIANWLNAHEDNWIVPYHHGTFHDFKNIRFEEYYNHSNLNNNGQTIIEVRQKKYRFNLILLSNFLTQIKQVEELKKELQNCMRYSRDQGKLVVVGASGSVDQNKDYVEMYENIKRIITKEDYSNHIFKAHSAYLNLDNNKQSFNYNDRFGKRIKEFNKTVLSIFEEYNVLDNIEPKFRKTFIKSTTEEYSYESKWEFHIFEKYAKPKGGYSKVSYNSK